MPTIPPVNTQQVLSMGTHTEKLQQTVQNQPLLVASQLDEERRLEDELKRAGVQNPDESSASVALHPDGRRQAPRRRPARGKEDDAAAGEEPRAIAESGRGGRVDITV